MIIDITLPCDKSTIASLKAGDLVNISGTVYTARDCAHKRLLELINSGSPLPFDISGQFIYYAGPCPAAPGQVSGSCGPTTSSRMHSFAPTLVEHGLAGMIGKGEICDETGEAFKKYTGVYFAAIGGAGALYGSRIKKSEIVAFEDLLSEAVYKLEIENFPCIVALDCKGNSIYKRNQKR